MSDTFETMRYTNHKTYVRPMSNRFRKCCIIAMLVLGIMLFSCESGRTIFLTFERLQREEALHW